MELILNLNSSWACGLKYVSMYFSSDGVTQQVHMIPGVLVKRINFHSRNDEKRLPNPSKILQKSTFGAPWEPFVASWQASWTHAPKRLDCVGFGEGPGRPRQPIWLQFHVLRTYRRAAGWLWKAESECQQGCLAAITATCPKKLWNCLLYTSPSPRD